MNNNPIGIFDSGLGGLSVWKELRRAMPNESLLYYGDGKNCPYGDKPFDVIRGYVDLAVMFLKSRGVKIIVVACNTASAAAIEYLRKKYPDDIFVGMEPAVKPAALSTRSGVIAVLATEASFRGKLFRNTVAKFANNVKVLPLVGKGFVELVEAGISDNIVRSDAHEIIRRVLEPALKQGVDKIVLGCTHYPFLVKEMYDIIGNRDIEIIDPATAVARHVANLLNKNSLEADVNNNPKYEFNSLLGRNYESLLERTAESIVARDVDCP